MDSLPVNPSNSIITFAVIGSFFLMFLLTIYCFIRHTGTAYSDVVRSLRGRPPPAAATPASTLRRKGGGVDSATVNALPLVSYGAGAEQRIRNPDDCAICLSEFEEKETVKLIPRCRHVFHPECLDTWLASHVSCPLCRTTQFFKTAGDELRLHVEQ